MTDFQAFILGLVQGLTEFLPVSSSGHLELGNHFFHHSGSDNLLFTLTVHLATVFSTLVVFRNEIVRLFQGLTFKLNLETRYLLKLLFSAIPVAIVGLFFRKQVEAMFTGNLLLVGCCLLVTSGFLFLAHFHRKKSSREIGWGHSMVIGLAQAVAVLPGLSRSGATIATGILLGIKRDEVARFSFLMVILPVLGATFLDFLGSDSVSGPGMGFLPLAIGFITAFLSGLLACKWMISLVNRGKLIYFAVYCSIVGLIAIFTA